MFIKIAGAGDQGWILTKMSPTHQSLFIIRSYKEKACHLFLPKERNLLNVEMTFPFNPHTAHCDECLTLRSASVYGLRLM